MIFSIQQDNGVSFIGPSSGPIKSMGDKIESKRIATAAKVNMIPGYDGEVDDEDQAVKIANDIGEYSSHYHDYFFCCFEIANGGVCYLCPL